MDLYRLFGEILGYPTPSLHNQVDECLSLLTYLDMDAVSLMNEFRAFLQITPLKRMEEIYTRTFDLQAICHPYVGYHLFGSGGQRGMFMAGLVKHYNVCGFSAGNELPDHLGIMLRFASTCTNAEREELVNECIAPAVKKMVSGFEDASNPYRGVLQALLLVLKREGVDQTIPTMRSEGVLNGR
jgi:nitrate reductase delta subunit